MGLESVFAVLISILTALESTTKLPNDFSNLDVDLNCVGFGGVALAMDL